MSAIERALGRERTVVGIAIAALILLAWIYLWRGAGMGMSALTMTRVALFPHLAPESTMLMTMPAVSAITIILMWWIMMIAMMLPSAAPLLLLYARVIRHAATNKHPNAHYSQTAYLAAGYLSVWFGFSVAAASVQFLLQRAGLLSNMMLWSQSALLSAILLAAAGAYQLSPLKYACLNHCRSPAHFLTQHMGQGKLGAFRMGVGHGIWCTGCCWLLMALLFVGGVMNVVWIALLTALVLLEKFTKQGVFVGRLVGVLFLIWGAATLLV